MKHGLLLEVVYRICLLLLVLYLILIANSILNKVIKNNDKVTYIYESLLEFDLKCTEE